MYSPKAWSIWVVCGIKTRGDRWTKVPPVILSIKMWHGSSLCTHESPLNVICAYARGIITFPKRAYHSRKVKFLPVNEIASLMWKKLKHDEEKTSKLRMREKRYAAPLADVSIMTKGNFRSGLRYIFTYEKQKILMFTPEELWNIFVKVEAFVKL